MGSRKKENNNYDRRKFGVCVSRSVDGFEKVSNDRQKEASEYKQWKDGKEDAKKREEIILQACCAGCSSRERDQILQRHKRRKQVEAELTVERQYSKTIVAVVQKPDGSVIPLTNVKGGIMAQTGYFSCLYS